MMWGFESELISYCVNEIVEHCENETMTISKKEYDELINYKNIFMNTINSCEYDKQKIYDNKSQ